MALEFINRKRARWAQGDGASDPEPPEEACPHDVVPPALARWFTGVLQRTPPRYHPAEPDNVLRALASGGAVAGEDFNDMSVQELRDVWPCLRELASEFLATFPSGRRSPVAPPAGRPQGSDGPSGEVAPPLVESATPAGPEGGDAALAALGLLAAARFRGACMEPKDLADAVQTLGRVTPEELQVAWARRHGGAGGNPRERALQLVGNMSEFAATQELLRRELCGWHRSAYKYASAVRLWGQVARGLGVPPWPPTDSVLGAFAFAVQNGNTLMTYCTQVRAALRLVRIPLGCLEDTSSLARGAAKPVPGTSRFRARASAHDTRSLAGHVREVLRDPLVADSFVVARHFCLRFASEVVPLEHDGPHSRVVLAVEGDLPKACIYLHKRKMHTETVVVTRRCICALQSRQLCGVCVLQRRAGRGRLFPGLSYRAALATLKAAALALGFERAAEWGTHAFRRGWADECLAAGGVPALFHSGGWRGVAAFGYASAASRDAMTAAEWPVEFSDSSASDGAP